MDLGCGKSFAVQGGFLLNLSTFQDALFYNTYSTRSLGNIFRSLSATFFYVLDSVSISVFLVELQYISMRNTTLIFSLWLAATLAVATITPSVLGTCTHETCLDAVQEFLRAPGNFCPVSLAEPMCTAKTSCSVCSQMAAELITACMDYTHGMKNDPILLGPRPSSHVVLLPNES